MTVSIGILVFDGAEELDFVGPWEVFSMANEVSSHLGQGPVHDVKLIAALPNPELPEGIEADLNHLFHERIAETDQPQTDRAESHACITPSLTIDWPTGPARG